MAKGKFALGALFGAAVGAVAALLTAPKSGKETREDLLKKAEEMGKTAQKRADQAKLAAKDSAESIKQGAHKVSDAAVETARGVKGNVEKHFTK